MRIITGRARGLRLIEPKNYDVRPTSDRVKESLFSIIGAGIVDAKILDLFAGTGNLCLESWSRGANHVTFVDQSKESLKLVTSNIEKCKANADCTVINGNALNVLTKLASSSEEFDYIFCDPPYDKGLVQEVLKKLAGINILKNTGTLVVEHSLKDDIRGALGANYEVFRSEKYGQTRITCIRLINGF